MTRVSVGIVFTCLSALSFGQKVNYPVYETDKIPATEHAARRAALKEHMGPGSIGVFFTNSTFNRNGDVDFLFRGDSNFLYLTGFEEPDAALILVPDGYQTANGRVTEILFVNEASQFSVTWLGHRMGSENAKSILKVDSAMPNSEFKKTLTRVALASRATKVYHNRPPAGGAGTIRVMAAAFSEWRRTDGNGLKSENSWSGFLGRAREIKSKEEIRLLQKSVDVSSLAHVEAMKSIKPGMREYEISAVVKYVFEKNGCEYTGYPPIVASGPNSTILHYNSNRRKMVAGDIVCMDTAGEYHGYTADITRSFPVSGKFTVEQRQIYEIVLKATDAGIAACRPGASRREVGQAISSVLSDGLMRLGIISNPSELSRYFMHGWGHNIGLDVHDIQPRQTLEAGITLTIEPGIYIKEGSPCDKKWWNIGIRVEDNVLITEQGRVNMSKNAPRTVAEIERVMKQAGIGS